MLVMRMVLTRTDDRVLVYSVLEEDRVGRRACVEAGSHIYTIQRAGIAARECE